MPKYDRQLIIMFHVGTSSDVKVVKDGAHLLNKKGKQQETNKKKSHVITAPVSDSDWWCRRVLKDELRKLTGSSRLYIYGHSDWGKEKVGTYTGSEMADLLCDCGLQRVKLISIVACKAARDYDPDHNLECFASRFLSRVAFHNCETDVFARSDITGVWPKGDKVMLGRKWTRPDDKADDESFIFSKAPSTKWKFTYANQRINKEVVTYPD